VQATLGQSRATKTRGDNRTTEHDTPGRVTRWPQVQFRRGVLRWESSARTLETWVRGH